MSCHRERSPNILLIVVDDLGYADMGCTGLSEDVNTPNMDLLAESGVRFTQAYATSPICNPSRCGIMTGCYPERWGTWWYGGPGLHDPEYKTIAELLKDRGYHTAHIGKVHYGSSDSDTSSRSFPLNHGFNYFFGFTSARKHYLIHHTDYETSFQLKIKAQQKKGQSLRQQGLWENTPTVDTLAFSTELFTKKALEIIRNPSDKPFFIHLSYNAVHNFTHQLPQEYLDQHGLEGYHDWDPASEEYYDWYQKGRYPNNPEGRAHYLGQLHYLDEMIGWLLHELIEQGIDQNTVVVLVGDNGGSTPIYANNHPLKGSKYILQEGGIRVPMLLSWPGRYTSDTVFNNVVSAMDILPTLCRAANILSPDHLNGIDLSMLLTGADPAIRHDTLVWDTRHEGAVRAGKWKYHRVQSIDHAVYEMVELEKGEFLYDLENDPGEKFNLARQFPDTLEVLKQHHQNWKKSITESQ
jgi:arylsulfatase A-like enzyme